ncbi:MAG: oligoendopeptidase F [Bacilli bacterium]
MEKKRNEIDNKYKWDLTKMVKDEEDFLDKRNKVISLVNEIKDMKSNIMKSSDTFLTYLKVDEELSILFEGLYIYAYLYYYQDMADTYGKNLKSSVDSLNDSITSNLSFVSSEILSTSYDTVKEYLKENNEFKKYEFMLEKMFRYQKYSLSECEEKIIAEATNAFGTPFDVFNNMDNVDIDLGFIKDESGKKVKLTHSNYIKYMGSNVRSVRKDAFNKMYSYFKKFNNTISASFLGSIKENFFYSKVRGFNSPLEQSLYSDAIEVDVYDNLITKVHDNLFLMDKYMKVRNKCLGKKQHMYDIYVDLVLKKDKDISFDDAKKHLFLALKPLGSNYLLDLEHAFNDKWIDIYPNEFKRSGAYQWGSYGYNPYVSINFDNTLDSVSTLAHELGHAMHTFYSNKNNTFVDANYPIFLAEIASTVNEVLVDDYFYKNAKSNDEKIIYLTNFLDKFRTTIYRQTMFAEFEKIVYNKFISEIPLTSDELCNTYYELNKLYYGKNVVSDESIRYEWSRIPHFYTPFYVYKYATGLASALTIASELLSGNNEMKENYKKFLSAGGSNYPLDILKSVGIDMTKSDALDKAFKMFNEKLEELERIVDGEV